MKNIYRSKDQKIIAGVCGGIGEYFEIDPVVIRIIFVVLMIAAGTGLAIYIILWLIIPEYQGEPLIKNVAEEISNAIKKEKVKEEFEEELKKETAKEEIKKEEVVSASLKTKRVVDSNALAGYMIIALGVIILIANLIPQIRIWEQIANLWPLVLVFFGLAILTKKN